MVILLSMTSCRNYTETKRIYDENGNITDEIITEYKSKFTDKAVVLTADVTAAKAHLSTDMSGSSFAPSVDFGFFWTLFASLPMDKGTDLTFYKEDAHYYYLNSTGKTFIHIRSLGDSKVKIKSDPKVNINTGLFKFKMSPNDTTVDITGPATVETMTSGGNTVKVNHIKNK